MQQSFLTEIRDAVIELLGEVKIDSRVIPVRAYGDNETEKDDIAIIVRCYDSQPAHEDFPQLHDRKCKLEIAVSSLIAEDTNEAITDAVLNEIFSFVGGDDFTASALASESGLTIDAILPGEDTSQMSADESAKVFNLTVYVQNAF
jgi:hypothetical protein